MASKPTPNPPTLMETSPGGENTQYEGAKVFLDQTKTSPSSKQEMKSRFGTRTERNEQTEAEKQEKDEKRVRGEKTAENVRYGQAMSENGFGGVTVGNDLGGGELSEKDGKDAKGDKKDMRSAMGYADREEEDGDGIGA